MSTSVSSPNVPTTSACCYQTRHPPRDRSKRLLRLLSPRTQAPPEPGYEASITVLLLANIEFLHMTSGLLPSSFCCLQSTKWLLRCCLLSTKWLSRCCLLSTKWLSRCCLLSTKWLSRCCLLSTKWLLCCVSTFNACVIFLSFYWIVITVLFL